MTDYLINLNGKTVRASLKEKDAGKATARLNGYVDRADKNKKEDA